MHRFLVSLALLALACSDARRSPDAATPDGGWTEPSDAGPSDAGPSDAGISDAGISDAGPADAGPCPLDAACDDGDACTEGDRCTAEGCAGTPRVCEAPPAAECIGDTLRTYAATGVCEAGDCRYAPADESCLEGCTSDPSPRCEEPPPREWIAIGGSGSHVCAVRASGAVHCWGSDRFGQLGDGTPNTRHLGPVEVMGVTNAIDVAGGDLVGEGHTCAVLATGRVMCWGKGVSGQLGNGADESSAIPVEVTGLTDAVQVVAGIGFTCALRASGQVACWGAARTGSLGHGSSADSNTPVAVVGLTGAVQLSAGIQHVCALDDTGQVWCWGYNEDDQIGSELAASLYQHTPIAVTGLDDATQIASGSSFNCALRPSGVACWGDNAQGQLGSGAVSTSEGTPITTAMPGAVEVAAGQGHTCVRFGDGSVDCWGRNNSGQLGNRSDAASLVPVGVFGLTGAHRLIAGGGYTCVIVGDTVECWGSNYEGTLGNGTRDNSLEPVAVWLPE